MSFKDTVSLIIEGRLKMLLEYSLIDSDNEGPLFKNYAKSRSLASSSSL